MSGKVFSFRNQNQIGKLGEQFFAECYKPLNPKYFSGRKFDFLIDKWKIELKTDFYDHDKTSNFFFEKVKNSTKNTLGGPYKSLSHNVDYYVYLFIKNRIFYWIDVKKLCARLDSLIENRLIDVDKQLKTISNVNYESTGLVIDRNLVSRCVSKVEKFNLKFDLYE